MVSEGQEVSEGFRRFRGVRGQSPLFSFGTSITENERKLKNFFMGFAETVLLLRSWQLLKLGSCGHATQICEYMPYLYGGY